MSTDTDSAPRTSLRAGTAGRLTGTAPADPTGSTVIPLVALSLSLCVPVARGARERESRVGAVQFAEPGSARTAAASAAPPQRGRFGSVARPWRRTLFLACADGRIVPERNSGRGDRCAVRNVSNQVSARGGGVSMAAGPTDALETLYAHPAAWRGIEERDVAGSGSFCQPATARVIEVMVDGIGRFGDDGRRIAAEPV
ncbi:carbonic anhydrase [Nocardia asiatica]|uniref:hypothetical protein n=1 Tax=Nocardia asiatica TaxID=209252 RepID=UPI0003187174|nr:hypothetical protein [Nocardia asiatica]